MNKINIEEITKNIRKEIENRKIKNNELLDFISLEISKTNLGNQENVLDKMINYVEDRYNSKDEIRKILQTKIDNFRQITKINNERSGYPENKTTYDLASLMANTNIFSNMKQLFNKLEKNRDLSDLQDGIFHFNKTHMGIAKRIFFLQITQNYLSALKYVIISDIVTRQSAFNTAIEDTLKNIIGMITELEKETKISITELRNYKIQSEKWIQSNEYRIIQLEDKINKFDGLEKTIESISSTSSKSNHGLEIKITEIYNELKEMIIARDLKTTEYLLEKISSMDDELKKLKSKENKI